TRHDHRCPSTSAHVRFLPVGVTEQESRHAESAISLDESGRSASPSRRPRAPDAAPTAGARAGAAAGRVRARAANGMRFAHHLAETSGMTDEWRMRTIFTE